MAHPRKEVSIMTKMTYVVAIDSALNGVITDEVREKLEALKTRLEKKSSATRKPTKSQRENETVKADILALLSDEGKQCKDIAETLGISGQKCSALLKQMVEAGLAEKFNEKRVTYFKAVEG
jgi:predicted Rossmann fold nucleotide-binding protein DprA/Smf involved in DNA uptake